MSNSDTSSYVIEISYNPLSIGHNNLIKLQCDDTDTNMYSDNIVNTVNTENTTNNVDLKTICGSIISTTIFLPIGFLGVILGLGLLCAFGVGSVSILLYPVLGLMFLLESMVYPSIYKYCDDYFIKCDYHEVVGTLVSNTITKIISNNLVNYELSSSFDYTLENSLYTCEDLVTNIYSNLTETEIISQTNIGSSKKFYVSYHDHHKCALDYKWHNKVYSHTVLLFTASIISLIVFLWFGNSCICGKNKFIGFIIVSPIGIFSLITIAMFDYYYLVLFNE